MQLQFCCKDKNGIASVWLTEWEHWVWTSNEREVLTWAPHRGGVKRAPSGGTSTRSCRERQEEAKGTRKPCLSCTGGTLSRELPTFSAGGYKKDMGESERASWEGKYKKLEAFWREWDREKGQMRCLGKRQWDFFGTKRRRDDWSHPCCVAGKLSVDNWFNPSAPIQEKLAKTVISLLSRLQLLCHRQGPAVPQTVSGGK